MLETIFCRIDQQCSIHVLQNYTDVNKIESAAINMAINMLPRGSLMNYSGCEMKNEEKKNSPMMHEDQRVVI